MKIRTRRNVAASGLILLVLLSLTAGMGSAQQLQEANAGETGATTPSLIQIDKTVDQPLVEPGHNVAYTVVLTNTGAAATVDSIADHLPAPFQYVGLALGSGIIQEPTDTVEPEIVWTGPFEVPANGTLTLRYWVSVPPATTVRPTPYSNAVTAKLGATTVGPASADVEAVGPEVQVSKEVAPAEVEAGDTVTYTVTFQNAGKAEGVLNQISDVLPAGFTFLSMVSGSGIDEPPTGTTGTIVWAGPVTVPAEGAVTLVYKVKTALSGGAVSPTNKVEALMDGGVVGPASVPVHIVRKVVFLPMLTKNWDPPQFIVEKAADPTSVSPQTPGAQVVYTVRLRNGGDVQGVLGTIKDTLPSGFTFLNMEASSDVHGNPSGSTGTIVWNGPFNVPAHSELELIYRVRASSTSGTYVNSVTATTLVGAPPPAPASATVTVKPAILFSEDFEDGIDAWTPFTNYWRLKEGQWFWDTGAGVDGSNCYTFYGGADVPSPDRGAHDALSMYLGEGSDQWTDYRVRAKFNVLGGNQAGIWFRGTFKDEKKPVGRWVTGYYFSVKPGSDSAVLMQLRTEEEPGDEVNPDMWYKMDNAMELAGGQISKDVDKGKWYEITVEVRDDNIKGYVDDELIIDFTDEEGSVFLNGTIGLYNYGPCDRNCAVIKYDDILVEPLY